MIQLWMSETADEAVVAATFETGYAVVGATQFVALLCMVREGLLEI